MMLESLYSRPSSSSSCNLYSALILRQCSDSMALLPAYAEAIPHSEEGTVQTQPPSQQYCSRYLDDAILLYAVVYTQF